MFFEAAGSKAGGLKAGGSKAGGSKAGGFKAGVSKPGGSKAGGSIKSRWIDPWGIHDPRPRCHDLNAWNPDPTSRPP